MNRIEHVVTTFAVNVLRRDHVRHVILLAVVSCGPRTLPQTESSSGDASTTGIGSGELPTSSSATASTTSTAATASTGTGDTDPSGSGDSSTSAADFIVTPDGGGGECGAAAPQLDGELRCWDFCDVFAQDCDEGFKCAAAARNDDGAGWSMTRCIFVTGDGVAGEPCTAEAGHTGVDDCAFGHMCWDVDDELHGTCVALCTGSEEQSICPAEFGCLTGNEGVLNLCLPRCDPLVQDCPDDELCIPSKQEFLCVIDNSGESGAVNDPCSFVNACDKGLLCVDSSFSAACMQDAVGCCQPFCAFPDGACPNPDQTCRQFFDPEMDIPPGHEDVGICRAPP